MLFFTPKRPLLKDLIPNGFVDIHSHLIPGIDDGAATLSDATQLITTLQSFGFHQFITTPHIMEHVWNNTKETIANGLEKLTNELTVSNKHVPISAAAEYLLDGNFKSKLNQEKLLTLKDNIVLVELSYRNPPIQLYDILFELQLKGYKPLLAHPERYVYYADKFSEFKQLKHAGCLFQLNLLAATGYYGKEVLQLADLLLKNGMYDFVGSDIHNLQHCNSFQNKVVLKNTAALEELIQKNSFFAW